MRKLTLLAVVCILLPFIAYTGKLLGFWHILPGFDILAHFTVSLGLALGMYVVLKTYKFRVSYLNIILPVMLIGIGWEIGQMILGYEKLYISNAEALNDLGVDLVGAMIGAEVLRDIQ